MSKSVVTESQSQVALALPVKSAADFTALGQILQSASSTMNAAADAMGTVHFARFVRLNDSTLAFISEFDGSFADYVQGFLKHLAPVFDQLVPHLSDAPPTPVASNPDVFISWLEKHNKRSLAFYTAYPNLNVKEIKSQAGLEGTSGGKPDAQNFLAEVWRMKSLLNYMEMRLLLPRLMPSIKKGADDLGILHFANFVDLGNETIALFTIYDGDFRSYSNDFAKTTGPAFDELMKHVINPSPTPVAKNTEAFFAWSTSVQHDPIVSYSAYPTLGVQDIKALATAA